jgi:hypothetical protein
MLQLRPPSLSTVEGLGLYVTEGARMALIIYAKGGIETIYPGRSGIGKGKPSIASGRLFPSLYRLVVFFPDVFADYVEGNARKFVARLANLFRSE